MKALSEEPVPLITLETPSSSPNADSECTSSLLLGALIKPFRPTLLNIKAYNVKELLRAEELQVSILQEHASARLLRAVVLVYEVGATSELTRISDNG